MSADFWAGYVSGAAGIVVGNPLDLLKTRLQAGAISTTSGTSSQTFVGQFESFGTLLRGMPTCMFASACFRHLRGAHRDVLQLTSLLQCRRYFSYPWLRFPEQHPFRHLQSFVGASISFFHSRISVEYLDCGSTGWIGIVRGVRTNGAHKMQSASCPLTA